MQDCVLHLALEQQYSLGISLGEKERGQQREHTSHSGASRWSAETLSWWPKSHTFMHVYGPLCFILTDRHHMQTCFSCPSSLKAIDGPICALLKSSLTAPFPSCKLLVHIRNNMLYFEQLTPKRDQPWKISSNEAHQLQYCLIFDEDDQTFTF